MKLSIIIPTKDRYNSLLPVLNTLLKYLERDDYEIIIQDNSTDNTLILDYLFQNQNIHLKYFYTSEHIDIVQNCNKAIQNSSGKYICFIGDDDLVSPYIMDIVDKIDQENVKCLVFTSANYIWKNVTVLDKDRYNAPATLTYYTNYSSDMVIRHSHKEMERVLQMGGIYFLGLPRFYHGIVRRDILEILYEKFNGTYFPGPSPDMAISAALSIILETYHYMHYPVTITGVSKNSGAGLGIRKAHVGRIEEQAFLPAKTLEVWDKYIPRIWTGFTIYAESLHEVFAAVHINKKINYLNLYAAMYQYEPYVKKHITPIVRLYCKDHALGIHNYYTACLSHLPRRILKKMITQIKRIIYKNTAVKDLSTVEDCMHFLKENTRIKF